MPDEHLLKATSITLYKNVPLDKDYKHTFAGTLAIPNASKLVTLGDNSYQRIRKNTLRIAQSIDGLTGCNYLSFNNTKFEGRNFYAFVTEVNYINNNTTELVYDIDVMTTYWGCYNCKGLIEREHATSDDIGENIVQENIGGGDLICQDMHFTDFMASGAYCAILYTPNRDNPNGLVYYTAQGVQTRVVQPDDYYTTRNGVFCGLHCIITENDNYELISEAIAKMVEVGCSIAGIYIVPHGIYGNVNPHYTGSGVTRTSTFKGAVGQEDYTPKNNKLFTYPYRQIYCSNNAGTVATFKWELTSDGETFEGDIYGTDLPTPEAMFIPTNYRGIELDVDSGVTLSDFPVCVWNENSYERWWSQNKNNVAVTAGFGTINTIAGVVRGMNGDPGGVSQASSGAQSLAKLGATILDNRNIPDRICGQINATNLRLAIARIGFTFYDMGITAQQAEYIDNYFEIYGYAQNKIGSPWALSGSFYRNQWCFVKMQNANVDPISSGMSAEDQRKIEEIFNRGITFWKNYSYIGDYSQDNSLSSN